MTRKIRATLLTAALALAFATPLTATAASQPIVDDQAAGTVTMADGGLRMVYDYHQQSVVKSFTLNGTELLNAGMYSAVTLSGSAFDSRTLSADPTVTVTKDQVTSSFTMGNADLKLTETWTFRLVPGAIQLHVDRSYDWLSTTDQTVRHNGMLSIGWARVWDNIRRPADGGDLPIGNAYTGSNNFYLSQPNDRYGVEESDFVMLRNAGHQALDVQATGNRSLATEFAYTGDGNTYQETQVSSVPTWNYTGGTKAQGYVYGGHSANGTTGYIYAPVTTTQGQDDQVDYRFAADDYDNYYGLGGRINGITDTAALSSLLNDFGRSGVIDSGYGMSTVGLRYPGVGPYDMVYADRTVFGYYDPRMTASQQNLLSYFRDYAQQANGHMDGRTYHLDHPWGDDALYDADPSYAMAVADVYQYSADRTWLTSMRASVEKAIAYMVTNQYVAADGLFRNDVTNCTSLKGLREWNDALYIKYESGYVNELMYQALTEWSALEQTVFADPAQAASYASLAAALKAQFNKDDTAGGLWDAKTGMFAYWRCPDGTVQGNVEQTQINLQAIFFGLVDLPRARQILTRIDTAMQTNHLSLVPQNFEPLKPNVEDWSGDHFPTGLEDGATYPLMTEEYMRAAALVGERNRSLTYLNNTVARYTTDGFNGWSHLDWNLAAHGGEAWFPSNANGATGLFTDVLGIQPTAAGVTIAPNIPASMNGSTVTRTIHANDSLTVFYHDELNETVSYGARQPVTLQWSGQTPSARYTVIDNGGRRTLTADSFGIVRYTFAGPGQHNVHLLGNANGYVLPTNVPTDLALHASVTASSSQEDGNWGVAKVVDGQNFSVDGSWGWSSDSDLTANHTEWVTVDLGAAKTLGSVALWPQNYDAKAPGTDFPIDFTIEVSNDGTNWTTVASETGYPKPTAGGAQTFNFTPRSARYLRVQGTNLRADQSGQYQMQLAEIEAFGREH